MRVMDVIVSRSPRRLLAGALVFVLLAVASVWFVRDGWWSALASHDPVTSGTTGEDAGFDMVIDDNGDTTIDNGPNFLGPINPCISTLTAGSSVTFDVFLDGIPSGQNLASFIHTVSPGPAGSLAGLIVTARHTTTAGINILAAQTGSGPFFDFSTTAPAALDGFLIAPTDFGTAEAPPTTVRGVITRFTVSTSGASNGLYPMVLTSPFPLFPSSGIGYFPANIIDGLDDFGIIAVGVACPSTATPTTSIRASWLNESVSPCATTRWSSTTSTRMGCPAASRPAADAGSGSARVTAPGP